VGVFGLVGSGLFSAIDDKPQNTMPNFYYTDANGQRGLINEQQLKALAVQGIITPDTPLESEAGHKGKAGQIRGLFASMPPPPITNPDVVDDDEDEDENGNEDEYDYKRIASALRLSTVSILTFIATPQVVMIGAMAGSPRPASSVLGLVMLGAIIFSFFCGARLARSIHYSKTSITLFIVFAVCLLPLGEWGGRLLVILGFLPLFTVYFRALYIFKKAGYKVDLLGADMQQFGEKNVTTWWVAGIAAVLLVGGIGWAIMSGKSTARLTAVEQAEIDRVIAAAGGDINAVAADGSTALHRAVFSGSITSVQHLVSIGADIDVKGILDTTPLQIAVNRENLEVVQFLVSKGADVHAKNVIGNTSLHVAASHNKNVEIARFLVSQGADIHSKNAVGNTPLHLAAGLTPVEFVQFLISVGADINATDNHNQTPLHAAVSRERLENVEVLVSQGADVHAKAEEGLTPLHVAATVNENIDIAKYLLSQGADVNAKAEDGVVPLHHAALAGNIEVARFLVSQGADIHAETDGGMIPLDFAELAGHTAMIDYLERVGIASFLAGLEDVNAKNEHGLAMLHRAAYTGNIRIVELLLAQGADVNVKCEDGGTPLHYAAHAGNIEVAQLLVSGGADVNAKDYHGSIPLNFAEAAGHTEMVQYLSSIR